jgi:hypothetical protein
MLITVTNIDLVNGGTDSGSSKVNRLLKPGQEVKFFAEHERSGTWDEERGAIREPANNSLPWGILAILMDKKGWISFEADINDFVK